MEIRPSYGRELCEVITSHGIEIDEEFNYHWLPDSVKDAVCAKLINICLFGPTECVPGCAQFGDELATLFQIDQLFYCATLRIKLIDHAIKDTSVSLEESLVHSAELLQCEATARLNLQDKELLFLLFSDPHEFIRVVNVAFNKYLQDFAAGEIEDVLGEVVCH